MASYPGALWDKNLQDIGRDVPGSVVRANAGDYNEIADEMEAVELDLRAAIATAVAEPLGGIVDMDDVIGALLDRSRDVSVRVRRVAVQSIPDSVLTSILFDTEDYDTDAMFVPTSAPVIFKTAGKYSIKASVSFQPGLAVGFRQAVINKTGTPIDRARDNNPTVADDTSLNFGTDHVFGLDPENVTLAVFQSSGVALNATATLTVSRLPG